MATVGTPHYSVSEVLRKGVVTDSDGRAISRAMSAMLSETSVSNSLVQDQGPAVAGPIRYSIVAIASSSLFCDYLLLTLCIPILPEFFGENFSLVKIGILFASKPFFQFFANPLMGSIVEKYGPRTPLVFGIAVLSISTFLFAIGLTLNKSLSLAYLLLLSARSVQGLASASIMSAGMTLCALAHDDSTRGTAMGLAMTGLALGTLLGPPLGGIIGYHLNLWSPFVIIASLLVVIFLYQSYQNSKENFMSDKLSYLKADDNSEYTERLLSGRLREEEERRETKIEKLCLYDNPADISILRLLSNPHILFIGMLFFFFITTHLDCS
jgi:MFS family permease